MKKRVLWRRIASGFLALCLLLMSPITVNARTVGEIEAEQKELEEKQASLEAKLDELKNDEAQKREYQDTLQQKIDVMQAQIDSARRDIDELNANITELTLRLDKSREEIENTYAQFKERLVALYKAGDVSTLEILLNSNSFSDFAMRTELINAMSVHDQQLMDIIAKYIEDTQSERDELEESKRAVATLKKQLEKQQEELTALYEENAEAIAALEDAEANTQQALESVEAEREANDAEMQELIRLAEEEEERRRQEALAAGSSGGSYDYPTGGGGVEGFNPIWPLPGVSYVSCYYGGYDGHRGMDIAGKYGTPVVAAESGTVIKANDYDSWGMSWGYYVLIYHNSTFTTRYAHLSGLTVYEGQYVEQGTIVGYEGATGNVTGPHLHFEVYQNGNRVDPMIYL